MRALRRSSTTVSAKGTACTTARSAHAAHGWWWWRGGVPSRPARPAALCPLPPSPACSSSSALYRATITTTATTAAVRGAGRPLPSRVRSRTSLAAPAPLARTHRSAYYTTSSTTGSTSASTPGAPPPPPGGGGGVVGMRGFVPQSPDAPAPASKITQEAHIPPSLAHALHLLLLLLYCCYINRIYIYIYIYRVCGVACVACARAIMMRACGVSQMG